MLRKYVNNSKLKLNSLWNSEQTISENILFCLLSKEWWFCFGVLMPCGNELYCRRFRGPSSLHHQDSLQLWLWQTELPPPCKGMAIQTESYSKLFSIETLHVPGLVLAWGKVWSEEFLAFLLSHWASGWLNRWSILQPLPSNPFNSWIANIISYNLLNNICMWYNIVK
jgi:hypothetical protein